MLHRNNGMGIFELNPDNPIFYEGISMYEYIKERVGARADIIRTVPSPVSI